MIFPHQQALSGRSATRSRGRIAAAIALLVALLASPAYGADYSSPLPLPDFALRGSESAVSGSPTYPHWDGFYFGAQAGRTFGTADFGNSSSSLISYMMRNSELQSVSDWTTLPQSTTGSQSFGGFMGYNIQWGEVVTGVELNYNHMALSTAARDSVGFLNVSGAPQPNGDMVQYAVKVDSNSPSAIS